MREMAGSKGRLLTVDEWVELEDPDVGRRELVDGLLQEPEVTGATHDMVAALLHAVLVPWASRQGGFVCAAGVHYAIDERNGRIPDTTVFLGGRRPPAQGLVRTPPDIAIEIISPSQRNARRDRVAKLRDYARFGVRFYWLVDPNTRSVEINELGPDGKYIHAAAASEGVIGDVPGCPGLALDLDALWAEVDRLEVTFD